MIEPAAFFLRRSAEAPQAPQVRGVWGACPSSEQRCNGEHMATRHICTANGAPATKLCSAGYCAVGGAWPTALCVGWELCSPRWVVWEQCSPVRDWVVSGCFNFLVLKGAFRSLASSSMMRYCSSNPVESCPGSEGCSLLATLQAISNVCLAQLCFGLPTLRVGGRMGLLFRSVTCFIGSASGSRIRCPSNEMALSGTI